MKTNELIAILRDEDNPNVLDYIDDAADALESQQKRIEELEAERRWIPVSERLPAEWWHKGDDMHAEGPMEFIVFIEGALVPTVMYFNGESFIDWYGISYNVTHWMPLPEPPKEG